jgi:beta-lactamase regulating signal transducer with metallopeptidase domain/5-hydroxyisourate hydrolase-like protein (transthyretin family)
MHIAEISALVSREAPALVAALLHSLWQAALLAVLCEGALQLVPFRRPNWRYGTALSSLALVVLLFLVTWRLETRSPNEAARAAAMVQEANNRAGEHEGAAGTPPLPTLSPPSTTEAPVPAASRHVAVTWQAALVLFWVAGVVLMVLRATRILGSASRVVGLGQPVADPAILALLDELAGGLGIARRVAVATLDTACSPAVVGVVSPVVLVPASLLAGSSPEHLRAILAHELAHIRRWDVLVNLLQLLVESLLFHNPFVWLLSAQIRHEREACCDAVAAECCGGGPAYARVLVDVGEAILASTAAMSFAQPGGLSDRVRRLLGLRPARDAWRLPARSLVVGLVVGLASLFVVAQGTFKATDAVLSARERIALIEQTVDQQRKATAAAIGTTRYSGRVETLDGGPLPKGTTLILRTIKPHSSGHTAYSVDRKTGHFEIAANGTTAMLWLRAPGYTPWFQGPTKPGPEPVTDTGLWVLEPQIPLVVRVLDDEGSPVPNAEVAERCSPVPNSSFFAGSATTDAGGECIVPLVPDYPVSIDIKAASFEPAKFEDLYPVERQPLVLTLRPSIPLALRVTDRATGDPIANATVRELQSDLPKGGMSHEYGEAPILATSGPDGVCSVSGLHREGVYWLLVEAAGHGAELVAQAVPGEKLDVRLGPPRVLKGTITGDLSELGGPRDKPKAWVYYSIQHGDRRYCNIYTRTPIRVENGVGTFRIGTLFQGTFDIGAAGVTKTANFAPGETEIQLRFSTEEKAGRPSREVRLVFEKQPGLPLPRGTMRIVHRHPAGKSYLRSDLPVTGGGVSLSVPLGSNVEYRADGVIGGWFRQGKVNSVAAGDGPLTVRVPYVPAGAISVAVVDKDGKPADGFLTSVQEIKKSPYRTGMFLQVEGKSCSSPDDGIHAFTATPLPLDGTYEIVVSRGFTYVTTGPIEVTAEQPLHKRRLVLTGSATISGHVVGPAGEPARGVTIGLGLNLANSSFGASDIETDEQGRFEFPGVVPHRGTTYTISLSPTRDFVPTYVTVKDLDQPLRIVLDRGLVLTGRILDAADGAPVPGDEVKLWRQATDGTITGPFAFHAEGLTARDGSFRFSNLAPGTYKLHSEKARRNIDNPTVTAGQSEPVVWRVPIGR